MHITRLVKSEAGGASFETIDDPADVIKLAGRHAPLDVVEQFAVESARDEALDATTRLAIGAGFDALRDAGIPLVMRYKTTTLGTQLPDRWGLPDALRDDTGVIFASRVPGLRPVRRGHRGVRRRPRSARASARARGRAAPMSTAAEPTCAEVERLIAELRDELAAQPVPASTVASCSACCRWATRSSPRSSAPAARTRRSTPPARRPPRRCRSPRTGSVPDAAAGWSSCPPTTSPATR